MFSHSFFLQQRPSFKVPVARQTLAREKALAAVPVMPEYPEYAPEEPSEFGPGPVHYTLVMSLALLLSLSLALLLHHLIV